MDHGRQMMSIGMTFSVIIMSLLKYLEGIRLQVLKDPLAGSPVPYRYIRCVAVHLCVVCYIQYSRG